MLRLGLIGYGLRGSLGRVVARSEDAAVAVVCDTSTRGRTEAAADFPEAVITDDLAGVWSAGLDAVLVLVPDHLHAPVAIAALRAGVAVFCEKPLATTLTDAESILRTAFETGSRLYLGHNMRHLPAVRLLRSLITEGRIGAVQAVWCRHFVGHGGDFYFKDWHADRRNSTGLLLQKGAHDLDVISWLAGGRTVRVAALGGLQVYGDLTGRRDPGDRRMTDWYGTELAWPPRTLTDLNPVVDVEDVSMMIMELAGGVRASYQQCHFTPDYWRNYTVIGDAGRIENLGDGPGGRVALWDRRHRGWAEPDHTYPLGGDTEGHGGADAAMIAEFLRFVRDGGPTDTSPVSAYDAVAAAITATTSLRGDGSALAVPALPDELVTYFASGQLR